MTKRRGRPSVLTDNEKKRARDLRDTGMSWQMTARILSLKLGKRITVGIVRYAVDDNYRALTQQHSRNYSRANNDRKKQTKRVRVELLSA